MLLYITKMSCVLRH